ncbi:MAG: hypothetical protein HYS55_00765, partial [Candidatus Omnitrophica bacterium]|nr:hypothetical protein [Candidatus Omnitrophota bacterium]
VTEKRLGAFLKVPVHVRKIQIGLLRHISLTGLEIGHAKQDHPLVFAGVKRIVVRYDLASFLKRNFRIPTQIFLDAPRFTLQAFQDTPRPFNLDLLRSEHGILTRFEFEEGEIELPWFRPGGKFLFTALAGEITPKRGDFFDIHLKSKLGGVVQGAFLAYGEMDPKRAAYQLVATLADVEFTKESRIPITQLNGTVEFLNDKIRLKKLTFLFRGIPCELSGEIENAFSGKPVASLAVRFQEARFPIGLDALADFKRGKVGGMFQFADRKLEFTGILHGTPKNFSVSEVVVNKIYELAGHFDSVKDEYQIEVTQGEQRFRFDFSIGDFIWELAFKLDHFKLYDFDLVALARIVLTPEEEVWQKGERTFRAHMETDYLIFQYQPLQDFKLDSKVSGDSLSELVAHWGRTSELRGNVLFGRNPELDLTLRVGPLPLNELRSFGLHPLPLSLEGILEGKLAIRGPANHPLLEGLFTIEGGKTGNFKYDRAVFNFSGGLPYLVLKNSKVVRGKNSFILEGGFDFSRRNFMEGVQVKSSEHIVVWKGLELNSELQEVRF